MPAPPQWTWWTLDLGVGLWIGMARNVKGRSHIPQQKKYLLLSTLSEESLEERQNN